MMKEEEAKVIQNAGGPLQLTNNSKQNRQCNKHCPPEASTVLLPSLVAHANQKAKLGLPLVLHVLDHSTPYETCGKVN